MKKLCYLVIFLLLAAVMITACQESGTTSETTVNTTLTTEVLVDTQPTTSAAKGSESTAITTTEVPQTTVPSMTAPATTAEMTTAATTAVATTSATTTTQPVTTVVETTALPMTYTSNNWMSAIPDDALLNSVAIPGTHNSGAAKDFVYSQCQTLSIAEQLQVGVRFFDIRLVRDNGVLRVYHGVIDQEVSFDEVLTACYAFLEENPFEALIMCIKEEEDAKGTNAAFDTMVKETISADADKWYTAIGIPTMAQVRGKIVLMRRYSTSGNYGVNASSGWSDNTTFRLSTGTLVLSVQDHYQVDGVDQKWKDVEAMFKTMQYKKGIYYLNFTSGYVPGLFSLPDITAISNGINPKLIEYLKTSPDFVQCAKNGRKTHNIRSDA